MKRIDNTEQHLSENHSLGFPHQSYKSTTSKKWRLKHNANYDIEDIRGSNWMSYLDDDLLAT